MPGCIGDIFRLARRACVAGWERFLIADALTDRQLKARTRPSEETDVSVIGVQARTTPRPQAQVLESILAKRQKIAEDIADQHLSYEYIGLRIRLADIEWAYRGYMNSAILIHDPDSTILRLPLRIDANVQQALLAGPTLPAEIRSLVLEKLSGDRCLDLAPDRKVLDARRSTEINVIAITPMSDRKHSQIQLQLNTFGINPDDPLVSLHRWKAPTSATQADVFALAKLHSYRHYRESPLELILLDSSLWSSTGQVLAVASYLPFKM